MTNKILIHRFIKQFLIISISVAMLLSCDIIDKATGSDDEDEDTVLLNGKMEFYLDEAVTDSSSERSIKEIVQFRDLNGKFINDRYEGSYWYESLGRTFFGNVKITFNDNPESIDFHLNGQYTYESFLGLFGEVSFSYTVDYSGMPYEGLGGDYQYHVYSERGSAVQKINVTWSETNWYGESDKESSDNLIRHNCGAGAYITVEVDKRE